MKPATTLICVILISLDVAAGNSGSSFAEIKMPEVNIQPLAFISQHEDDPFNQKPENKITDYMNKGSFALRAKNLTIKEFLEVLCFLSGRNYSFSNGILNISERFTKVSTLDKSHKDDILKLANEILIPEITFRHPATIVDAVNFFYKASQDYDDPEKLKSKRGINFAVKSPGEIKPAEEEEKKKNEPVIVSDNWNMETLLKAIKRVCEKTNSRFIVYGKTIVFLPDENKK